MKSNRADREQDKFLDINGKTTVRVTSFGDSLLSGVEYDEIQAEYPLVTRELYKYFKSAVLVATLQVDYSDATKKVFVSVKRL